VLDVRTNELTGTIPKAFATLKSFGIAVYHNLLTGNATLFVDRFGGEPFQYNCFDPAVPPSNPPSVCQ
jgi:hypothetical protein